MPFGKMLAEALAEKMQTAHTTIICWLPGSGCDVVGLCPDHPSAHAPSVCGWGRVAVHFVGTVFVISIIEEFFWRGWLYRFLQHLDFLDIDLGKMHWVYYLVVATLFGIEHREYVAGIIAGLAWGFFMVRTRDIWALCISHASANLTLALYVFGSGHWRFW